MSRGKAFAVFVANIPIKALRSSLRQIRSDGELLIVSRTGGVVLHSAGEATQADTMLAIQALQSGTWRDGFEGLSYGYHKGVFTVSDRLPGTDWVLAYAWSWQTVLAALAPEIRGRVTRMMVVLCLLWLMMWGFDRMIFSPVYVSSQRVFDSENLNRLILSTAPVGLGLFALDNGDCLQENARMQRYRGIEDESSASLGRRLVRLYHEQNASVSTSHELSLIAEEGVVHDLLVNMVPTRYRGRDVLLCGLADITERRNIERALQEARRAAEAANRAKSTFLAAMSHEIRTPLAAMLGQLELMQRVPLNREGRARLSTIEMASGQLREIVEDILDMSRIEAGQMMLEEISFSLVTIIQSVAEIFTPMAVTKGLVLSAQVVAVRPAYRGDPTRIRQILTNLIGNALKFTERGTVSVRVTVTSADPSKEWLQLVVEDTGIGISPSAQAGIFEPFQQADVSIARRFGGTGLGLALCKKMVELMGGTITVASATDCGSTFTVALPLRPDTTREGALYLSTPADCDPCIRVLVVDDQPLTRALIHDQCVALGYLCNTAEDGRNALRQCDIHRYDVVLTDLCMPGIDGYTLTRCLREQDNLLPIIGVTAGGVPEHRERCLRVGMTDVLHKPVSLAALDAIVRKHVRPGSEPARSTAMIAKPPARLPEAYYNVLRDGAGGTFAKIRDAVLKNDLSAVATHTHALKGMFAMVNAAAVIAACDALEHCVTQGVELTYALDALNEALTAAWDQLSPIAMEI
ncbi:hypothetical protein WT27_01915 [Burkholderia territorii]|uniref:Virulence sensor protein BvgS n=2 Tax=Burkholderia territorii TaxID=1503055 RepID=A0A106E4F3_9BURK|nr:hypothetical protein WT27_01915 [Burkholderia territorii]KVX40829.1 hypothetical protein WT31_30730 [Burkholderia territorii]